MHRGNMIVKVLAHGKFVDVPIAEGELFLLPGRIPHSPQRFENTIGLVIERERMDGENDCLRWYVPCAEEPKSLYEEFFHCHDLGQQLKPVIQRFFASEQHKTGLPLPGSIIEDVKAPILPDPTIDLPPIIPIKNWIAENAANVASSESGHAIISDSGEFKVFCYAGPKSNGKVHYHEYGEGWIWQWKGTSTIHTFLSFNDPDPNNPTKTKLGAIIETSHETAVNELKEQDCYLVQQSCPFKINHSNDSVLLVISMKPKTKVTQQ
jgi:3-hydroxyanthranilate 3,4-dioxygenase